MSCTRLFSGIVALFLLTVLSVMPVSALGGDIVFTGCPPYVQGNHCDSLYYGLVAVDLDSGRPLPSMRYFLVSGPGEINEKTGLWTFHPENMNIDNYYREEVVVGARHGNRATAEEDYCRFDAIVRNQPALIEGGCGTHHTVLPGDTIAVEMTVTDPDWCDDPVLQIVSAIPEPIGELSLDPATGLLMFVPDPSDFRQTFEVVVATDTGHVRYLCVVYFDVFEPEPIEISLSQHDFGEVQPGDTVSVDVIVKSCPEPVDRIELFIKFGSDRLDFIGVLPGQAFFDPVAGCGWDGFDCREYGTCLDYPESGLRLIADAGVPDILDPPNCIVPDTFPAVLATLRFVVEGPGVAGDEFVPVDFFWCYCSDNMARFKNRSHTFVASQVLAADGSEIVPTGIPGPSGVVDSCYYSLPRYAETSRRIFFQNGGIRMNVPFVEAPYRVRLGYHQDVLQGHFIDVPITLEGIDPANGIGGFEFLIGYDASVLAFQMAVEGEIYYECGWEYFTYRYNPYSDCDGCPNGLLKVVGLAEVNNGPYYAGCEGDTPGHLQPELLPIDLAYLRFLVSNDRTLEGQFVPIRFFWYDCGDNTLANYNGWDLLQSSSVFDYGYDDPISEEDSLPTYQGTPDKCIYSDPSIDHISLRAVDFYNGGVDIYYPYIIDCGGDINLNGLAYEIADALMYSNYFINGLAAFGVHPEGSIAASDVNADGLALTVADFIFLVRVMIGDALPSDEQTPSPNPMAARWEASTGVLSFNTPDSIGAVHLVVEGEITPTLLADHFDMKFGWDTGWTKILIYSFEAMEWLSAGNLVDLSGATGIVSIEAATYQGRAVQIVIDGPTDVDDDPADGTLPSEYALHQNYPNPFNPETTIEFDLPRASDVRIDIFNITGQKVRTLIDGRVEAGHRQVRWNGRDLSGTLVSSGVYLYRITAADFVQTRKMLLMK